MKTPGEILKHQLGGMSIKYPPVLEPHIQRAMKEYAKQWIGNAADIARFDCGEMRIAQKIEQLSQIIDNQ